MITMKYEIDKFDGNGDFTMWTKIITSILGTHKALKVLKDPNVTPRIFEVNFIILWGYDFL